MSGSRSGSVCASAPVAWRNAVRAGLGGRTERSLRQRGGYRKRSSVWG